VPVLDGDDDQVGRRKILGAVGGDDRGEPDVPKLREDRQAVAPERFEVRSTRQESDRLAGGREPSAEVAADAAGPDESDLQGRLRARL